MLFMPFLDVLNFDLDKFDQLSSSESLTLSKMTFLDRLNSPKIDFT